MFYNIVKKLLFYIQIVLIAIYLILEELVWDRFAKPLFRYIKYLKLFQRLEQLLQRANRYVILVLFLLPFIIGELLGLLSPILVLKGYVVGGIVLYVLKLLIVTFAFWLFKVEQKKLLSFKIINYGYKKIVQFTRWIKTTQAFITITRLIKKTKIWIKLKYANFKTFIKIRFNKLFKI